MDVRTHLIWQGKKLRWIMLSALRISPTNGSNCLVTGCREMDLYGIPLQKYSTTQKRAAPAIASASVDMSCMYVRSTKYDMECSRDLQSMSER